MNRSEIECRKKWCVDLHQECRTGTAQTRAAMRDRIAYYQDEIASLRIKLKECTE